LRYELCLTVLGPGATRPRFTSSPIPAFPVPKKTGGCTGGVPLFFGRKGLVTFCARPSDLPMHDRRLALSSQAQATRVSRQAGVRACSAGVAQLVEHLFCKQVVGGSSPPASSVCVLISEGCPSGQREQAVNLPAHAYVGSNPSPSTNSGPIGARNSCRSFVLGVPGARGVARLLPAPNRARRARRYLTKVVPARADRDLVFQDPDRRPVRGCRLALRFVTTAPALRAAGGGGTGVALCAAFGVVTTAPALRAAGGGGTGVALCAAFGVVTTAPALRAAGGGGTGPALCAAPEVGTGASSKVVLSVAARAGGRFSLRGRRLVGPLLPPVSSCGSSSIGRASAFQAERRGFESLLPLHTSRSFFWWAEHLASFPRARDRSSSPPRFDEPQRARPT
jgi:hypothetical protein